MAKTNTVFINALDEIMQHISNITSKSDIILTSSDVDNIIANTIKKPRLSSVDSAMAKAMIQIESSNNPLAMRFEPHLGEASFGLMQILPSTAQWLASDMGYSYYGSELKVEKLLDPEIGVYFGISFIDWLQTWKNEKRTEQWIVESYNGGPNNSNKQTLNHWGKYQKVKNKLT